MQAPLIIAATLHSLLLQVHHPQHAVADPAWSCACAINTGARAGSQPAVLHIRCSGRLTDTPSCILQAAIQHAAGWVANINTQALVVGGVSLVCSLFTPAAITRFVPGSLLGLVAGTLTSVYTKTSYVGGCTPEC